MSTKGRKQSPEHIRKRIENGLKTRAANYRPKPPKPCEVAGCHRPTLSRRLCNAHYLRWAKYGTTDLPSREVDVGAYLARKSVASDGCRVWTGVLKMGYGTATIRGRSMPAHVAAWTHANGPVPEGLQINHKCHNRACCNPEHLYAGTQKQNMADMLAAGRANHTRGEKVASAKLTEPEVRQILVSKASGAALAREYGVSQSLIRAIRQRLCWKWLEAA